MIGSLRGVLRRRAPPWLLIEVQGVGYELEAPLSTFYDLPALGAEVELHTHLVVREDAHLLYGFARLGERDSFRELMRVRGIGARLALAMLSTLRPDELARCIESGDVQALARVPGIGKKTAERLILELKGRLAGAGEGSGQPGLSVGAAGAGSPEQDACTALIALGYKPQEADRLVRAVAAPGMACEALIRAALKSALAG